LTSQAARLSGSAGRSFGAFAFAGALGMVGIASLPIF
jgi:glutamate synthase domain-containing protein 3